MGLKGHARRKGGVRASWRYDEGKKHAHVLKNVRYVHDSLFNLFSATEFGKDIGSQDQEVLIEGTPIQFFSQHSFFY